MRAAGMSASAVRTPAEVYPTGLARLKVCYGYLNLEKNG